MKSPNKNRIIIATILVVSWAVATAYAFWWFEFKNLRPFDTNAQGEVINPDLDALHRTLLTLIPPSDANKIRVVHFWNPDCYCNRFNREHFNQIKEQYEQKGVEFYLAVTKLHKSDTVLIAKNFGAIPILELGEAARLIPSTPSAAILKPGFGLTYFGPYSEGVMCSAQSGSFVETTLDATLEGYPGKQTNLLACGCYCDPSPA